MNNLKKDLSFFGLVALGAAGVIGSSWIYTNGSFFAKYGAGGEIFGLIAGVLMAVCISLAYAELCSTFPRAGGAVVYSHVAFGPKMSFVAGWALIGAFISSLAFYVSASSLLLSKVFPGLASGPYYTIAGVDMHIPELLLGIAITLAVFVFNYFGAKLASSLQKVLFLLMIAAGVIIAIVGYSHGSFSNFWFPFAEDQNPAQCIIRFILPAMTFLTGFELVAVMAEEANIEAKKIGACVIFSVIIAGSYYVLVLTASAVVIPWQETATMGMGTIDAFKAAGFPLISAIAFTVSVLGLITSFIGLFAATPRLIFSLARANMLPKTFTKVHPKYGTPVNALWFTLAFTLGFGWIGKGAVSWFLDIGGFTIAVAWVISVCSFLKLRKKYPHLHGEYRVRAAIFPILGAVAAAGVAISTLIPGTNLSLVWPAEYIVLAVWIIAGLILFNIAPKNELEAGERELLGEYYDVIKEAEKQL